MSRLNKIMERIREQRKIKNISQEEASKALNVSQSQYSKYERAAVHLTIDQLIKIAKLLKTDISELTKK